MKLLINSPPLQVLGPLAKKIGVNEAMVLQQVHYWLELNRGKPKSTHRGRTWCFNSYEAWQATTFYFWSLRTVKDLFQRLLKRGLLVKGRFNDRGFDRTNWYTIDYDAVEALELSDVAPIVQKLHDGWCKPCTMDSAGSALTIPETTHTSTQTCTGGETLPATPGGGDKTLEPDGNEGAELNVAETHLVKEGKIALTKALKVSELETLWKQLVHAETEEFVPPLTMKQKGQIGLIAKGAKDQAGPLIGYAVKNWLNFVWKVQLDKGITTEPKKPNLDYLTKHWGVALNLMAKTAAHSVPTLAPEKSPPALPTEVKHKPATLEEIRAIEANYEHCAYSGPT